jgi:hypothetical protein
LLFTIYICGRSFDSLWAQEISNFLANIVAFVS